MCIFFSLRVSLSPSAGFTPTVHPVNFTLCIENVEGVPSTATLIPADVEVSCVVVQFVNVTLFSERDSLSFSVIAVVMQMQIGCW